VPPCSDKQPKETWAQEQHDNRQQKGGTTRVGQRLHLTFLLRLPGGRLRLIIGLLAVTGTRLVVLITGSVTCQERCVLSSTGEAVTVGVQYCSLLGIG
jgi:hypothetical protein